MATRRMGEEEKAGHGHGCLECTGANPGDSQVIPPPCTDCREMFVKHR